MVTGWNVGCTYRGKVSEIKVTMMLVLPTPSANN